MYNFNVNKKTALLLSLTLLVLAFVSFFAFFFVKSQLYKVTAVVKDVQTFASKSEPWRIDASDKQGNNYIIYAFGDWSSQPERCLKIPKVKNGQKIEFYLPEMDLRDLAGEGGERDVCFENTDPSSAFYFLKVVN